MQMLTWCSLSVICAQYTCLQSAKGWIVNSRVCCSSRRQQWWGEWPFERSFCLKNKTNVIEWRTFKCSLSCNSMNWLHNACSFKGQAHFSCLAVPYKLSFLPRPCMEVWMCLTFVSCFVFVAERKSHVKMIWQYTCAIFALILKYLEFRLSNLWSSLGLNGLICRAHFTVCSVGFMTNTFSFFFWPTADTDPVRIIIPLTFPSKAKQKTFFACPVIIEWYLCTNKCLLSEAASHKGSGWAIGLGTVRTSSMCQIFAPWKQFPLLLPLILILVAQKQFQKHFSCPGWGKRDVSKFI